MSDEYPGMLLDGFLLYKHIFLILFLYIFCFSSAVLIVCADGTTLYPADGEPKYYNESLSYILDDICTGKHHFNINRPIHLTLIVEYCQKFGVVDGHKKYENNHFSSTLPPHCLLIPSHIAFHPYGLQFTLSLGLSLTIQTGKKLRLSIPSLRTT